MRFYLVALSFLPVIGCGNPAPTTSNVVKAFADIPAPPAADQGFQVIGPELTIKAGADEMWCWVADATITEDHLIRDLETYQGKDAHHLLALASLIPRKAGEVFDCGGADGMATARPLMTPNTPNKEGTVNLLSDAFDVRLAAGTQIVMQSHYVNVTTHDLLVKDGASFLYTQPGDTRIEAQYFVINDGSFDIPPTQEHYTHHADCAMTDSFQFGALIGHMHEWGKHVTVSKIAAGTTTEVPFYDVADWTAQYRDAPPVVRFPLNDPLTFASGDTMRVTCDWLNDTTEDLTFPKEMCDSVMLYYPAKPEGFITCD